MEVDHLNSGRKPSKANKGFTLVEMILSVAFLAIISVVMLQLFINARNLGLKAHDLDQAVQLSKSVIETFKAGDTPADLGKSSLLADSSVLEDGDAVVYKIYFDKEWQVLGKASAGLEKKSAFVAAIEIKPSVSGGGGAAAEKGMYTVHIGIERTMPYSLDKSKQSEVYGITAEKYFGGAPGGTE
jgi:prepilin-type N-terminal cleavage/methylation domain-containing protein